jgi:hypothetical protein
MHRSPERRGTVKEGVASSPIGRSAPVAFSWREKKDRGGSGKGHATEGGRTAWPVDTVREHRDEEMRVGMEGEPGGGGEGGEEDDEANDFMAQWTTVSPPPKKRGRTSTLVSEPDKVGLSFARFSPLFLISPSYLLPSP